MLSQYQIKERETHQESHPPELSQLNLTCVGVVFMKLSYKIVYVSLIRYTRRLNKIAPVSGTGEIAPLPYKHWDLSLIPRIHVRHAGHGCLCL